MTTRLLKKHLESVAGDGGDDGVRLVLMPILVRHLGRDVKGSQIRVRVLARWGRQSETIALHRKLRERASASYIPLAHATTLMERFYRELIRTNGDKAAALASGGARDDRAAARRQACVSLGPHASRNPLLWAPFVLVGEAR
jgi:hypothetical protein